MILLPPGNSPKSTFEPSENTNTKVRMNLRTLSLISYHLHYFPPSAAASQDWQKKQNLLHPQAEPAAQWSNKRWRERCRSGRGRFRATQMKCFAEAFQATICFCLGMATAKFTCPFAGRSGAGPLPATPRSTLEHPPSRLTAETVCRPRMPALRGRQWNETNQSHTKQHIPCQAPLSTASTTILGVCVCQRGGQIADDAVLARHDSS